MNVILNIDVGNAIVRDCGCFKGACVNSQLAVVKEITPFLDLVSSQSCMSSRYVLCHHVISCRLSCYVCLFCLLEGCKRRLLLAKCPATWHFLGSEAFGGWHQILGKTPLWQSVSYPISMSHCANNYLVWFPASERLVFLTVQICSDISVSTAFVLWVPRKTLLPSLWILRFRSSF